MKFNRELHAAGRRVRTCPVHNHPKQKMKGKTTLAAFLLAGTLLQGCVAEMALHSDEKHYYSEYVTQTEQINLERKKENLNPLKIATFDEWRGGQGVIQLQR